MMIISHMYPTGTVEEHYSSNYNYELYCNVCTIEELHIGDRCVAENYDECIAAMDYLTSLLAGKRECPPTYNWDVIIGLDNVTVNDTLDKQGIRELVTHIVKYI